jgi:S1-C subfamily serine protease
MVAGAVVFLRTTVPQDHASVEILGDERMGTGVAVAPQRILTAHYVVLGAERVEVSDAQGRRHAVRKVRLDHETGLALLSIDGPDLQPVALAPGDAPRPGQAVFLIASVSERDRKGATGVVTSVGPFETYWEYMLDQAILSTCVNPGLAGAPLFEQSGRLVGLVTLGLVAVGRSSLAVPVDLYLRHREELEGLVPARPGRAWLGLYAQPYGSGIVVSGVVSGGPADSAGLKQGDVILGIDGVEATTLRALFGAIQTRRPGDAVGLQVLRDSSILALDVHAASFAEFFA